MIKTQSTAARTAIFRVEDFFPRRMFDAITDVRVDQPEVITQQAEGRRQRAKLAQDGKLSILACDHPGRGVVHTSSDPLVLGNRYEYLGRVLRIMTNPEFDGVMAPPDVLEELFIVNYLVQKGGGPSFLDDKVMIGCMQRGGIHRVSGEIDDRFGSYTPEAIARQRLEGGKMMFRFVPEDERTLKTIQYCAEAVTELHRRNLTAFVEPLPQTMVEGKYRPNADVPVLVKLVNVAAALGESSQHTWLKIPYVVRFEQVAQATTLPILLLGGETRADLGTLMDSLAAGMRTRGNVRGVMVGRNILFPGQDDPLAWALAVNRIVHKEMSAGEAIGRVEQDRGQGMEALSRWV